MVTGHGLVCYYKLYKYGLGEQCLHPVAEYMHALLIDPYIVCSCHVQKRVPIVLAINTQLFILGLSLKSQLA